MVKKRSKSSDAQRKLQEPHFFVSPTRDIGFRKLFGKNAPEKIAISFLNEVLELKGSSKIKSVTKIDSYSAGSNAVEPFCVQDMHCVDQEGQSYIVEVQMAPQDFFDKRLLFYFSRAYQSQLKPSATYYKLKKVFIIAIVGFNMFPNLTTYKHKAVISLEENNQRFMDDFQVDIIELNKFNKEEDACKTALDQWIYFFKQSEKLEDKPKKIKDEGILEAYEVLDSFNWTIKEQSIADSIRKQHMDVEAVKSTLIRIGREEGRQEGRQEGKEEGREEGRKEGRAQGESLAKLAIARKMLLDGMSLKLISSLTGLSEEELVRLK